MGILSDQQLMREVVEAGRVKNFDPAPDNAGRISAGLTSYGIDCRVGYKFRIFDPLAGVVVDPKAFDPKACREVDVTPNAAHTITYDHADKAYHCSRCGKELLVGGDIVDPPCPKGRPDHVILPSHSFALAESVEWFDVPRDTLAVALNKSTLLRCGLYVSTSVMEPEWKGTITLEISNFGPLPVKVYAGEGICQLIFLRSDERVEGMIDHLYRETHWFNTTVHTIKAASCGKSYADRGQPAYQGQSGITPPAVRKKENQ